MGIDRKRKTVYWSEEMGRFMKSFSVDLNMWTNKYLGLRIYLFQRPAERSVREAFKWSNFRVEIDWAIVHLTPEVRGSNPWPKVHLSIALKDPHKKNENAVIYSSSATMLKSHIATSKSWSFSLVNATLIILILAWTSQKPFLWRNQKSYFQSCFVLCNF